MQRIDLPPHLRSSITIYAASDKAGIQTHFELGGSRFITIHTPETLEAMTQEAFKILRTMFELDDVRPMTEAEVKEYLANPEDCCEHH